ncbi:essential MCU regulator, mitochondrial [Aegotheles albertisi]
MAAAGGRLLAAAAAYSGRAGRAAPCRSPALPHVPSRSATVTRSGAILPKPVKTPFGLLRVFSVVIPFLYVGTQISKNFAALLEEHDIFVPEDDDDDD